MSKLFVSKVISCWEADGLWSLPIPLNEVVSQCITSVCSWGGNTVVNIDPQGHVVTGDGGQFNMDGVTEEVRGRSPSKLPVLCEDRIKNVKFKKLSEKALGCL